MNSTTILVVALIIVGAACGRWLLRRPVTKQRIFAAIAALVTSVMIVARPAGSQVWHYVGMVIAVVTGTFLLMVFLRRWEGRTTAR